MVSRGKAVLIAAFVGLGGLMLFFYLYADSFQPTLQKITVDVKTIKVADIDKINNRAHIETQFVLNNPTKVTTTVSSIDYKLYANGVFVGGGHYSVEDVPMSGRPALFPGGNTTVIDKFELVDTPEISDTYNSIIKGEPIKYEIKGQATIESNLTLVTKDFDLFIG